MGGDPYVNTICTVCSSSSDDELLLLCELCDSAAHTYCVGLGTTVPEGDWFCKDCGTIRDDQLRWQAENQGEFEISMDVPGAEPVPAPSISGVVDEDHDLERPYARSGGGSTDDPVPSIYEIVGDDFATSAGIFRRRIAEDIGSQGTSAGSQCPRSTQGRDNGLAAYHAHIRLEVERARTLRNSRNLDKRIRELRENWAALRDGSVGFAPHMPVRRRKDMAGSASVATEHQRYAEPVTLSSRNGAAAASVPLPMPFSKETNTSLGHSKKVLQKDTRDARKAWKRLEMAKSSGGRKTSKTPASINCCPPFSMGNRSTSYSPIDTIVGHKNGNLRSKSCQQNYSICGHVTKVEHTLPTNNSRGCHSLPENSRALDHERMVSSQNRINQESFSGKVASSTHIQHVDQALVSTFNTHRPEKLISDMLHPLKYGSSSGQSAVTSSLQLGSSVGSGSQSTMPVNPEEPSAVCAEDIATTIEVTKSSSLDRHERKRKHSSERCSDQRSKRSRSTCKIAKSEISSLAIRELKLLKIDKTHGSDRFKEVARTATHSILAACRFEHSPSQSLALSRPVCKHSPKVKQLNSSAITDFCRECLHNFVKEAVSLALSGGQMDQTGTPC